MSSCKFAKYDSKLSRNSPIELNPSPAQPSPTIELSLGALSTRIGVALDCVKLLQAGSNGRLDVFFSVSILMLARTLGRIEIPSSPSSKRDIVSCWSRMHVVKLKRQWELNPVHVSFGLC